MIGEGAPKPDILQGIVQMAVTKDSRRAVTIVIMPPLSGQLQKTAFVWGVYIRKKT